jgi:outer membrane protein OmpA-like peptidoglycan-associated protein
MRIEGHTDRSGTATVNKRSALRRAEQVRDYLVAKGVTARAVSIVAHGEARPLIPTEDGVREVQNRRVEVILEGASDR